MAIPKFYELMLPFLLLLEDGKERSRRDVIEALANRFQLTDVEREERLASGQSVLNNRVGWAKTYLVKAGLMEVTRRDMVHITPRGKDILKENLSAIDVNFLKKRFPEFSKWLSFRRSRNSGEPTPSESLHSATEQTPEEALGAAYQELRSTLADDLLKHVHECDPTFFEKLVIELLVKMGYGGSRQDAGTHLGKSGDGGIDGIIKEDKLGLDVVYIQAKRWDANTVGRPAIQQFAGALLAQKAAKGIFLTTSSFSDEAKKYAAEISTRIILIDGDQLTKLMIEHDVGVSTVSLYPVKKIDSDYFDEEA